MEGDIQESNGIYYQERNGFFWHLDTPPELCHLLARAYEHNIRLKIYYGNVKTGRYWGDVETGTIGRSTGKIKIPLVIKTRVSTGGGALLDHCILRIERSGGKGTVLYLHEKAKHSLPVQRVYIHARGGVAYPGKCPKNVELCIIDHDNEKAG